MKPHPALTELNNVEHPFLYAPMIETFFRAHADYLIDVDEEHGAVRFTHSTSARYVIMARNSHIFGRPDLVLPWGHMRVRYIEGKIYQFAHRELDSDTMFNFINDRAPDASTHNAVTIKYSVNVIGNVFWHRTLIDHVSAERLRTFQYDVLNQVVAKSSLLEEEHIANSIDDGAVTDNWMDT